jgi:AcrR family transcriptional regulator
MNEPRRRAERVEVARSREIILDAAEAHYERHGSDPTMSELAQAAGVGNATLWRRFSSIDEVVRALYARSVGLLQLVADDMLDQQSGWDAVVALITGIAATIAAHPAIPQLTRRMVELEPELRHGAQWDADLKRIARRAQQEGTLRRDVDANDLTLAAFRIGDYVYLPLEARPRVIARQITITLDGLRADGSRTPLPGQGITTDEVQGYYRQRIPRGRAR